MRSDPKQHAERLTAIAAACAKTCGLDVRLTPLPEVLVQVGPDSPQESPPPPLRALGVRFDDEYAVLLLPNGKFRSYKISPTGEVVLRLDARGAAIRGHVMRVFVALLWDRLKRGIEQFAPQITTLVAEASCVTLQVESQLLTDPSPAAPREAPVSATQPPLKVEEAKSPAAPREAPVSATQPPLKVEEAKAPAPPQAPKPKPKAKTPAPPPSLPEPATAPADPEGPLKRRLRSSKTKSE